MRSDLLSVVGGEHVQRGTFMAFGPQMIFCTIAVSESQYDGV